LIYIKQLGLSWAIGEIPGIVSIETSISLREVIQATLLGIHLENPSQQEYQPNLYYPFQLSYKG
jgi:hypothetical protein